MSEDFDKKLANIAKKTPKKTKERPKDQEEITWGTYDGRRLKLSEIEDLHLQNIIVHIQERKHAYSSDTLVAMMDEALRRNLPMKKESQVFVDGNGKAKKWDKKTNRIVSVKKVKVKN